MSIWLAPVPADSNPGWIVVLRPGPNSREPAGLAARGTLDLPCGGLWVDEPQRVLAFGFLYFGMTGIGEVLGWARNEKFLKGVPKDPS